MDELADVALLAPAELVYELYYIFDKRVVRGLGSKHVRGTCVKNPPYIILTRIGILWDGQAVQGA